MCPRLQCSSCKRSFAHSSLLGRHRCVDHRLTPVRQQRRGEAGAAEERCPSSDVNVGRLGNLARHTRHAHPDGVVGVAGELAGPLATNG